MDFQVWDFPAQVDYTTLLDISTIFSTVGSLVWILDAQDEYFDAIERLTTTILYLRHTYPSINIDVFVHKVDGLSEDFRADISRDISQRVLDELADRRYDDAPVSFYQTSIYDHSIFEAFSRVIQRLIPQLPALEGLLSALCAKCGMRKAYLFDVLSKIYVASDTGPADRGAYETCSDYVDVIVDVSEIYGWERPGEDGTVEGGEGMKEAESLIVMERKGVSWLYLREVHKFLALVCVMGEDDPSENKAVIDYNVGVFQKALNEVFER